MVLKLRECTESVDNQQRIQTMMKEKWELVQRKHERLKLNMRKTKKDFNELKSEWSSTRLDLHNEIEHLVNKLPSVFNEPREQLYRIDQELRSAL
jgi:predicted  nucleic acid-binding Zn-ribbon protein